MSNEWLKRSLADVCLIKPPKSEARDRVGADALVSFAPMEDLGVDRKFLSATQVRPLASVVGSYTYFADGDVLLAKITPCFENGKLGIATALRNGIGFGSSEFFVLRPCASLDNEFLYYYLSRANFRNEGATRMAGAVGQQRVPKEFIENYPISIPPLPEQRRLVSILGEAFEGIATAKAKAEENLQNARALFESYRDSVFRLRGTGWREKPLSELCDIKHGFTFKSEYFTSSGDHILLTPGNFYESGGYRDRGEKQKYYRGPIPEGFVLSRGDLLVAMTEQAEGLLGSPVIIPDSGRFLHNQRLGLVKPKTDVPWTNEFFFHVFNLPEVRRAIHDGASGVKVRHTSPAKIGTVVVAFPGSISEQERIVTTLDELASKADELRSTYEAKLHALGELKNSLLDDAFHGRL